MHTAADRTELAASERRIAFAPPKSNREAAERMLARATSIGELDATVTLLHSGRLSHAERIELCAFAAEHRTQLSAK